MSTLRIDGFATGPFQTNCYVCIDDETRRGFVIDPGMGAAAAVRDAFEDHAATLEAVVLTHGHVDHVRDAAVLDVPVYIHPADEFMLEAGIPAQSQELFDAVELPLPQTVHHLSDGETITVAGHTFTVRHAPGHSPGSVLLVSNAFVFSGDVLFRGSVGRTDLDYSDEGDMLASLRGCVWDLDDALSVLPGHGPTTTVAQERATNPFILRANAGR